MVAPSWMGNRRWSPTWGNSGCLHCCRQPGNWAMLRWQEVVCPSNRTAKQDCKYLRHEPLIPGWLFQNEDIRNQQGRASWLVRMRLIFALDPVVVSTRQLFERHLQNLLWERSMKYSPFKVIKILLRSGIQICMESPVGPCDDVTTASRKLILLMLSSIVI